MTKIQAKGGVQNLGDLHRERWQWEPVLGKDSFVAVIAYAWTHLWARHLLTASGCWAFTATGVMMWMLRESLAAVQLNEKLASMVFWSGAHAALAWLFLCARDQARKVIDAVAERIKGRPA